MSVRLHRWIAALLLLAFTAGTMQAASASPLYCDAVQRSVAAAVASHGDHGAMAMHDHGGSGDHADRHADGHKDMSVKSCAAFCLTAVPLPAVVRLDMPDAPSLPAPVLDTAGRGWSPPGDNRPPRTSSIG